MKKILAILITGLMVLGSCRETAGPASVEQLEKEESSTAKALLQGIWLDSETETVVFKAEGDTIYYPDSTSQPAYFRIVDDSIQLGNNSYLITKQSEHVFCFQEHTGDVRKLVKGSEDDLQYAFEKKQPEILTVTEVVKTDSVVYFNNERYHWYIAVNPTRYRVVTTSYNSEGMEVENVYYDNIIHISLFKGAKQLFSRDFNKAKFEGEVPEDFLAKSILGNMRFERLDAQGFHFNATICIPDGASCYLVETLIDFNGEVTMKVQEY